MAGKIPVKAWLHHFIPDPLEILLALLVVSVLLLAYGYVGIDLVRLAGPGLHGVADLARVMGGMLFLGAMLSLFAAYVVVSLRTFFPALAVFIASTSVALAAPPGLAATAIVGTPGAMQILAMACAPLLAIALGIQAWRGRGVAALVAGVEPASDILWFRRLLDGAVLAGAGLFLLIEWIIPAAAGQQGGLSHDLAIAIAAAIATAAVVVRSMDREHLRTSLALPGIVLTALAMLPGFYDSVDLLASALVPLSVALAAAIPGGCLYHFASRGLLRRVGD